MTVFFLLLTYFSLTFITLRGKYEVMSRKIDMIDKQLWKKETFK